MSDRSVPNVFLHNDKSTWIIRKKGEETESAKNLCDIISPSILASDFANLEKECTDVIQHCEWLHVDVMDGHFVPNISIGPCVVESLRKTAQRQGKEWFLDVHLMVSRPLQWIEPMATAGASQYTFHVEAALEDAGATAEGTTVERRLEVLQEVCKAVHDHGMQCGLALKPKTELSEEIYQLIDAGEVDMLLIMTVEPGFGGQSFMHEVLPKVTALRERYPNLSIEVDGGLSGKTITAAADAGANVIVAGTSVFKAEDRAAAVMELRAGVQKHALKQ